MHLFTIKSVVLILVQTFFVSIVYYGNLYHLPIFSQVLRHRSIIASSVLLFPPIITPDLHRYPSWFDSRKVCSLGKYNPCICGGFGLRTLGVGLQTTFSPDLSRGKIIGYLIVEGFGIGLTFQTRMPFYNQTNCSAGRCINNISTAGSCSSNRSTKRFPNNPRSIRSRK